MYTNIGCRYDYASGGFVPKTELDGPFFQIGINFLIEISETKIQPDKYAMKRISILSS